MRTYRYASLAVLLLLGCQPPTPQEVAAQTAADVDALITGALDTARSTNSWSSLDSTYAINQPTGTVSTRPTVPPGASTGDTMRYLRWYSQRIFTEANAEPGSNGRIFIIRGTDICTSPDQPTATDSDCIRRVDQAQLKVRVGGNIDLALQVGPERLEPVQLQLRGGKAIAYVVDLALSQRAYTFLATALGTAMPDFAFEARGRYEMRLDRLGQSDYQASVSVLDDIFFAVTAKNGVRRAFSTERGASPLLSVRLDGARRVAIVSIGAGKTTWDGVGSDFFDSYHTGPLHAELAGLTMTTTYTDGATEQRISNLSLGSGTSFIQYSGLNVLTLDVNEVTGRRFDLAMRNTLQNTTQFEVTPSLDVNAAFAFSSLGPAYNEAFQNARYALSWKGDGKSVIAEWSRPSGNLGGQLRLMQGGLSLTSSRPADLPRQFLQGMCIGPKQSPGYMPHPILDLFEATACRGL